MTSRWKIILGLVLLTVVAIAQDAPKASSAAIGGVVSKTKITKAQAAEKQSIQGVAAANPARQGIEVDPHLLLQGKNDVLNGNKLLMTFEDMNATLADMLKEQREKLAAAMKEYSEKNKKDGEAFLAANNSKDGVVATTGDLQYKVLKAGDGKKPALDDKVVCKYRGTFIDGTEVDSSYKRNEPSTLPITGVIKGWTEALQLMPIGSKWQNFVPSQLAYGERSNRIGIGPNTTISFEVELLSILEKTQDPTKPQDTAAKPQGSM